MESLENIDIIRAFFVIKKTINNMLMLEMENKYKKWI